MHNSYPTLMSKDSSNKDIIDIMCDKAQLGKKCRINMRSVLGIEVENELAKNGLLSKLLHGKLEILEHTSEIDKYAHHDCICKYNGEHAYAEIKSTFSEIGAFQEKRNIDTLVMNNVQYDYYKNLCKQGQFVVIIMYYYPDNVLLLLDFRGTDFIRSTSDDEAANGEKTFYGYDHPAVLKRINTALSKDLRSKIRTSQWKQFYQHEKYCTSDRCAVQKHKI